jgi:pimeloyl-ACP methyl ester carboxylesterase
MRRAIKAHRRITVTENLPLGEANPLQNLPAASLKRPVLLVPGWDTSHDRFRPLTDKLTDQGANGGQAFYVREGQFYSDQHCNVPLPATEIPKDAKVFVTVLRSTSESPHTSAPQLKANLEAIAGVVPGPVPDIIAYSQGGLATRKYLADESARVGRLMFVGTPNLGAGLASFSNFVYRAQDQGYDVAHLLSSNNLDPEDRDAIDFMTVGSEPLQELNAGWDQQMARTEGFHIVGYRGTQTFHYGYPPLKAGDKLVTAENLGPEGVQPSFVEGPYSEHSTLPFSPGAYQEMLRYFGWHAMEEQGRAAMQ